MGISAKGSTGRLVKLNKPNNIVEVKTGLDTDFFRWWCVFINPIIKKTVGVALTSREMDVIACFLKQRWKLSKSISDPAILDSVVMGEDTKRKVIEECNITLPHFYVVMSNLRKNKIISSNKDGTTYVINPRLIPNVREDDNGRFQLLIMFTEG